MVITTTILNRSMRFGCACHVTGPITRKLPMKKDELGKALAAAMYHLANGMEAPVVQAKLVQKLMGQEDMAQESDAVERLFAFWVTNTRRDAARTKLTGPRRAKLKQRLRDSSEEDIRKAIRGCMNSPFHTGENDTGNMHTDLVLICRSRDKLESFIAMLGDDVIEMTGDAGLIQKLKQDYRDAQTDGDTERQNILSKRIREVREGADG